MATVKIYQNRSDNKDVDKSISLLGTYNGDFKGAVDMLNPVFDLELPEVPTGNYCRIEEFNRFYFIDDITSLRTGLFRFRCHVDVLMTYRSGIRGCTAIVEKQENTNNLYLNDGTFKVYCDEEVSCYAFPYEFTGTTYVLNVAGG